MIDTTNPFHMLLLAYGIYSCLYFSKNDKPINGDSGQRWLWYILEIGVTFTAIGVFMEILRFFS